MDKTSGGFCRSPHHRYPMLSNPCQYSTSVDLVLAMIYTETKGKTDDVMQSSESSTGVTNSITDQKESIRQGVRVLSDNLEAAVHHKVDPWTAVQAISIMWLITVVLTPLN